MGQDVVLTSTRNFRGLEIVAVGTRSSFHAASTGTVFDELEHGLGYTPIVLGFYTDEFESTYYPMPKLSVSSSSGAVALHAQIATDETKVYFRVDVPSASSPYYPLDVTFYFKYYLLRESAA